MNGGLNGGVSRVWAAKDYVDRKRIGIWGWVSGRGSHPEWSGSLMDG